MMISALLAAVSSPMMLQDPEPPKVKLQLPKTARVGAMVKGLLKVSFAPGLHGYQNPPTQTAQIPVAVKLASGPVKLISTRYPKGVLKEFAGHMTAVYEGEVTIPVQIKFSKAGSHKVTFSVSYQQCNESTCWPPDSIKAAASITVK